MDRRLFRRTPFHTPGRMVYADAITPCEVRDVSLRGIFVCTSVPLRLHDEVTVSFPLAGSAHGSAVRCPGRVVRRTTQGAGIELGDLDAESFVHLRGIVSTNSGDPDGVTDEIQRSAASRIASAAKS